MFADDCILLCEVSEKGIYVIKDILIEYEACSGQCVNFNKYITSFSSNVNDHDKSLALQTLNVRCLTEVERYLKFPSFVGRKKKRAFQTLKDRLRQKIDSWSTLHLYQGEMRYSSILFYRPFLLILCLIFFYQKLCVWN